jgi:molecular chaperone GrpE
VLILTSSALKLAYALASASVAGSSLKDKEILLTHFDEHFLSTERIFLMEPNEQERAERAAEQPFENGGNGQSNGQNDQRAQELEAQVKEKDAKYLYLYAEFENYKKRSFKELQDARKFGWENVGRDLLQVLDNLERAMAHTPEGTDKNLVIGLQMVIQQFKQTLQRNGVEEVPTMGKPFDPNLMEGMGQEPSNQPAGTVTSEQLKGYTIHGRLLRPARVMVSSGISAG